MMDLVLSLFPGIDLLGRGFEAAGFCVVRGPDLLWGQDIRDWAPPAGRFDGVIGGPPCQDFSSARRDDPTGYGRLMLAEFVRVVEAARPSWWLMENVPGVPDVRIDGYNWQRLDLYASSFGLRQRRLRHIQFGSRAGEVLVIERGKRGDEGAPAVMASDTTTAWGKLCERQGLPADFSLPAWTVRAARTAVGNAVPYPMAVALAEAVRDRVNEDDVRLCRCGCGRPVTGKARYGGAACRMRAMRRRRNCPD